MNYRTECLEIKNIYDKSEGNNMRLIDADALMRVYQEVLCPHVSCADCSFLMDDGNCRFETMIREAPTIDAVPVIRCRECKYWGDEAGELQRSDGVLFARCKVHNYLLDGRHTGWCPTENDFCSYGERKGGAD